MRMSSPSGNNLFLVCTNVETFGDRVSGCLFSIAWRYIVGLVGLGSVLQTNAIVGEVMIRENTQVIYAMPKLV